MRRRRTGLRVSFSLLALSLSLGVRCLSSVRVLCVKLFLLVWFLVGDGSLFWFLQRVAALVLLLHPVHQQHHQEGSKQGAHHASHYHRWRKKERDNILKTSLYIWDVSQLWIKSYKQSQTHINTKMPLQPLLHPAADYSTTNTHCLWKQSKATMRHYHLAVKWRLMSLNVPTYVLCCQQFCAKSQPCCATSYLSLMGLV